MAENQLFPDDGFMPTAALATYTGTYEVFADSADADLSNNTQTFEFSVSEEVFAKEDVTSAPGSITPLFDDGEPHTWPMETISTLPNGDGWVANQITFAIGAPNSALIGSFITVKLYEWTNPQANPAGGTVIPFDDRTLLGFANYEITGNENLELITVDILNFDNSPVSLGKRCPLPCHAGIYRQPERS